MKVTTSFRVVCDLVVWNDEPMIHHEPEGGRHVWFNGKISGVDVGFGMPVEEWKHLESPKVIILETRAETSAPPSEMEEPE